MEDLLERVLEETEVRCAALAANAVPKTLLAMSCNNPEGCKAVAGWCDEMGYCAWSDDN